MKKNTQRDEKGLKQTDTTHASSPWNYHPRGMASPAPFHPSFTPCHSLALTSYSSFAFFILYIRI